MTRPLVPDATVTALERTGVPAELIAPIDGSAGRRSGQPLRWGPVLLVPPLPADGDEDAALRPVRAYKEAKEIVEAGGEWGFVPRDPTHAPFCVVDRAVCGAPSRRHAESDVAVEQCGCGFYALDPAHLGHLSLSRGVLLEVDLYGTVLVGTDGYRAERQRVVRVMTLPSCMRCGSGRRKVGFYLVHGARRRELVRCCARCAETELALSWVDELEPQSVTAASALLGIPVLPLKPDTAVVVGGPPVRGPRFVITTHYGWAHPAGPAPGAGERALVAMIAEAAKHARWRPHRRSKVAPPKRPSAWRRQALERFLSLPDRLDRLEEAVFGSEDHRDAPPPP